MIKPLALTQGAAGALEIRLVLNRFEELNARVPVP